MPDLIRSEPSRRTAGICAGLALLTFLVYARAFHCGFLDYDDPDYVTSNPQVRNGLTGTGLVWAFRHAHASNWHPLTWISHMADCELWGLNPQWHHLVNVGFHAANTVLLFLLLRSMTGALWRSALVAGLFAWHPLHVESVAWVAERKDVLSTFFGFLALIFYARYVGQSKVESPRSKASYGLTLFFFALGLMSKPMLVSLPAVMLLLDYWPLGRVTGDKWRVTGFQTPVPRLTALVFEKLPLFAMAAAVGVITICVQNESGAVSSLIHLPVKIRLENAAVSYAAYLGKMSWPVDLALGYPYRADVGTVKLVTAVLLLAGVTMVVLAFGRRFRFLAVGWGWYLVMLLPVIGLVQAGPQAMADRYTYVPSIGLFIIFAWGGALLVERWRRLQMPIALVSVGILAACATATARQLRFWTDSATLFEHTLAVTSGNDVAHFALANALMEQGKAAEAAGHYREAVRLNPDNQDARINLAIALQRQGRMDEAVAELQALLKAAPSLAKAHDTLAIALSQQGQTGAAVAEYQEALRLQPDLAEAANGLAWLRATCPDAGYRNGPEAVELATHAAQLTGKQDAGVLDTLAAGLAEVGRFDEAVQTEEQARVLALAGSQPQSADTFAQRQDLYRQHLPYRTDH